MSEPRTSRFGVYATGLPKYEPPCGKTAKLISAFVFATWIVKFLFYFQASSSFLCLYRPVCVGPVRKPHCWFSHEAAHM